MLTRLGHPFAVLVCGGRTYGWPQRGKPEALEGQEIRHIYGALDWLHRARPFGRVIAGRARGADMRAEEWADSRGIQVDLYPADWYPNGQFDRGAGFKRNEQMLVEGKPDLVVGFPGGNGTAHMLRIAEEARVEVIRIEPLGEES